MPTSVPPGAPTPEDALERLREGNQRFVTGHGTIINRWHPGLTDGQAPFAVVLGCSDSRAPAEYVFDQGLGDLFVIRVAGNIVAPSLAGSIEFATGRFGTRLVVVMGHTQCGAVAATVSALEIGGALESRNMSSIVERIKPQIRHLLDEPISHDERLAQAVRANTLASARELPNASPILHGLIERGQIKIVAAVYDLATGVVDFIEP